MGSKCSAKLHLQERLCSTGEVLNCNVYDIATHAAVELAADKFIVMSADDLQVRFDILHVPLIV